MSTLKILGGAAVLLACGMVSAAPPTSTASVGTAPATATAPTPGATSNATVDLDGSVRPTPRGSSLAASAGRALQRADVPSTKTEPVDVKAAADADMRRRDGRPLTTRLRAERQNLKGDDAARALAEQQNPSTYDRTIQMGNDKDHVEQVTNLKIYLKK